VNCINGSRYYCGAHLYTACLVYRYNTYRQMIKIIKKIDFDGREKIKAHLLERGRKKKKASRKKKEEEEEERRRRSGSFPPIRRADSHQMADGWVDRWPP
jgi:hypothetical protein